MRASFVIVNYNRKDEILTTILKSREKTRHASTDFEIIIVDNASTDGSSPAIKATYDDVIVIDNEVNSGVAAWNIGFAKARGEYLVILDDDSHIESGLDEALEYLDRNKEVGILALNISGGAHQTSDW